MLEEIIKTKRREIAAAKQRLPLEELQRRAGHRTSVRSFQAAIKDSGKPLALIAELKRQSPSKGLLRERFEPVSLAQQLEEAGASALSVLTDAPFFGGQLEFLRDVHAFTSIPILRKDFILEPYQIYEAAYAQADAVLLIVRILSDEALDSLLQVAEDVGLDALVEVHDAHDLQRALKAGAVTIGINHRDLTTFRLQPEASARLIPEIPPGLIIVAESGVHAPEDVQRLAALGAHAVLIGEALMTAPDVGAKVRELFAGLW